MAVANTMCHVVRNNARDRVNRNSCGAGEEPSFNWKTHGSLEEIKVSGAFRIEG